MLKPVAESCLRNQHAIFEVLQTYLSNGEKTLLELGSGTGQHAVYIANRLPDLTWQPSDVADCLPGIESWRVEAKHNNVLPPLAIDVNIAPEHDMLYDVVFTANTIHYVSVATGLKILEYAAMQLKSAGYFFVYGPFKTGEQYTSEGDVRLEAWLQERDPESGIRDRQWLIEQSQQLGMHFVDKIAMPANNFIFVFQKQKEE